MSDTSKPDPLLRQVPLMRNPAFQPSKPITLNNNYNKLISNFSASVVPPKLQTSKEELESWQRELQSDIEQNENDAGANFIKWLKSEQTKIAPGYESMHGVITPNKSNRNIGQASPSTGVSPSQGQDPDVNELDKVFGKTSI